MDFLWCHHKPFKVEGRIKSFTAISIIDISVFKVGVDWKKTQTLLATGYNRRPTE